MQAEVVFAQCRYKDIAFVVFSCDKYADLWPIFFETFFDNWPDCPFQVYLVANKKQNNHPKVVTLLSGDDLDWSSSVRKAIAQLKENYVLFFYEDAFLNAKVSNDVLKDKLQFFFEHDLDYLRLRPSPKPDEKYNHFYGRITEKAIYRVSLFASIWKKSILLELLKDGESAWEFEMQGAIRSLEYKNFYSTYESFFSIIHGVERGKWINSAHRKLLKLGYKPSQSRGFLYKDMLEELFKTSAKKIKHKFISLFPATQHKLIIEWGGKIKRNVFRFT